MNESRRIAWPALSQGTTVTSADGRDVGKVAAVIADEQKDIFSGITITHGVLDGEYFVPADQIDEMTTDRVRLTIAAQEVENLGPYEG